LIKVAAIVIPSNVATKHFGLCQKSFAAFGGEILYLNCGWFIDFAKQNQ
jgi:hypothetical protein